MPLMVVNMFLYIFVLKRLVLIKYECLSVYIVNVDIITIYMLIFTATDDTLFSMHRIWLLSPVVFLMVGNRRNKT